MTRFSDEYSNSLYFPNIFSVLVLAAVILFSVSVVHCDTFKAIDKYCTFATQVQSSPYREQYIARLSSVMGTMVASNSHTDSSIQSDAQISIFGVIIGKKNSASGDATMDEFSRDCLACHDGMTASDVSFNFRNSPSTARQQKYDGSGKDHPNGMNYQNYVVAGQGKFKSVSEFKSNMKFIEGKVGCLTCHNPLNKEKGHLVMSDRNSALCLTCHNL
jgi:predicted CXXCH cytochrome family protein